MVWKIVKKMFDNTDSNGILIINGMNDGHERKVSDTRFYKCLMDWDLADAVGISEYASGICNYI